MHLIESYNPGLIFELRELSTDDVNDGEVKYQNAKEKPAIAEKIEEGLFDAFTVQSGPNSYQVSTLGFFANCTCKDFAFSGSACKHVVICLPQVCSKCRGEAVKTRGDRCQRCLGEFELYDVFRITSIGYRATQHWVVIGFDERGYPECVDRREIQHDTDPEGWSRLTLHPDTIDIYLGQNAIEYEGKFDADHLRPRDSFNTKENTNNGRSSSQRSVGGYVS